MNFEIKETTTLVAHSTLLREVTLELPGGIKVPSNVLLDILTDLEGVVYDDDFIIVIKDDALERFLIENNVMRKASRGNVWRGENHEAFLMAVHEVADRGFRKTLPNTVEVRTRANEAVASVRVSQDADGVLCATRENPLSPLDENPTGAPLKGIIANCAAFGIVVNYDLETKEYSLTYV